LSGINVLNFCSKVVSVEGRPGEWPEPMDRAPNPVPLSAADVEDITVLNKDDRTGPDPDKFDGR
jgi:hypothetical protein